MRDEEKGGESLTNLLLPLPLVEPQQLLLGALLAGSERVKDGGREGPTNLLLPLPLVGPQQLLPGALLAGLVLLLLGGALSCQHGARHRLRGGERHGTVRLGGTRLQGSLLPRRCGCVVLHAPVCRAAARSYPLPPSSPPPTPAVHRHSRWRRWRARGRARGSVRGIAQLQQTVQVQRRSDRVDLCSLSSLTRVPSTGVPCPVPAKAWGLSGRELPHVRSLMFSRDLLLNSAR